MIKVKKQQPMLVSGNIDINNWIDTLSDYLNGLDRELIRAALLQIEDELARGFAIDAAEILIDLGMDIVSIVVAILYPIYNQKLIGQDKILSLYGKNILDLLLGIFKMENISVPRGANPTNILQKMLLAVIDDVRVVVVKLALHTCRMRQAVLLTDQDRKELAQESKDIYIPLSNRLGIGQIKWELEDLSFRFLEPEAYHNIAKLLDERRIDREEHLQEVIYILSKALSEQNIIAELSGRVKHIYSIWKKMHKKMVNYDEIYDVRAVRVLVNEITDCYTALGIVHTLWPHIPKEFDDYIANPKSNGYQSLHTAVVGPEGKILEIQIRTKTMHRLAELGVAAHWKYKEGTKTDENFEAKLANLRQLINWQKELDTDNDFASAVKAELLNERIYVFSPQGKIVDLPQGATPLDFAYSIHTDLGHRCRGVKIDGHMVPLTKTLKNGNKVEILTAKYGGPSRDWLNSHLKYIKTSQARAKIQQWFRQQDKEQNIQDGRDLLNRELKRLGIANYNIGELAKKINYGDATEIDLLAGIGNGDLKMSQIFGTIQKIDSQSTTSVKKFTEKKKYNHGNAEIIIQGVGNLMCHMAKCCKPVSGEEIIGYITLGEGVSIHRKDCLNILHIKEEKKNRLIQVAWGAEKANTYAVNIIIKAYQRRGLLRDITAVLMQELVDVKFISTLPEKQEYLVDFKLRLEVAGVEMLARTLAKLHQINNVYDVYRDNA